MRGCRRQPRYSWILNAGAFSLLLCCKVAAQPASDEAVTEGESPELMTTTVEPKAGYQPPRNWIGRYTDAKAAAFANSDIVFARARTNAPFLPFAYVGARHYGDATFNQDGKADSPASYQQTGASAVAGIPFLINQTDALLLGAYLNTSNFSVDVPKSIEDDDFRVRSTGLAAAYFSQVSSDWQFAGFVAPIHHVSDQTNSADYWQVMSGAFARYTHSPNVWWAFGLFADSSPFDAYMLPYVGVSWTIDREWTVSAIMPWPKVIYSPSVDWYVSLGAEISGAGWARNTDTAQVGIDLNAFDFGLDFGRRVYGSLWVEAGVGVGGLRALQLDTKGDADAPELDVSSSPYFTLNFTVRPDEMF